VRLRHTEQAGTARLANPGLSCRSAKGRAWAPGRVPSFGICRPLRNFAFARNQVSMGFCGLYLEMVVWSCACPSAPLRGSMHDRSEMSHRASAATHWRTAPCPPPWSRQCPNIPRAAVSPLRLFPALSLPSRSARQRQHFVTAEFGTVCPGVSALRGPKAERPMGIPSSRKKLAGHSPVLDRLMCEATFPAQ
jgi:hypothetical protein